METKLKESKAALPSVQEYYGTVTVSYGDLTKMNNAQMKMKDRLKGGTDSALQSALNALSLGTGVIGIFASGAAATVLGLVSATSSVAGSYKTYNSQVVACMENGLSPMAQLLQDLYPLDKKYDLFEIEFLWLDFRVQGVRYFQSKGYVQRAHVRGGGWVTINM